MTTEIFYECTDEHRCRRRSGSRPQRDWAALDWTLTDAEIARRVGAERCWVGRWRRRLGMPPSPKVVPVARFAGVDWNATDAAIAARVGCSPGHAADVRRKLGRPPSPVKKRWAKFQAVFGTRAAAVDGRVRALIVRPIIETDATVESVSARLGVAVASVYKLLCRHTTREQRQAAKRRKIAARKRAEASGLAIRMRALSTTGARRVRACPACGEHADRLHRRPPACPKCGASMCGVAVVFNPAAPPEPSQIGTVTPPDPRGRARANVAAFLETLRGVA
jgi:hypothetical protein